MFFWRAYSPVGHLMPNVKSVSPIGKALRCYWLLVRLIGGGSSYCTGLLLTCQAIVSARALKSLGALRKSRRHTTNRPRISLIRCSILPLSQPLFSDIPSVMDDDSHARMYPPYEMERMPGHLTDITSNLMSNETLPRGPLVQGDEWANAWTPDVFAPIYHSQDTVEARYLIICLVNHQLTQMFRCHPLASTHHSRLLFRPDTEQLGPLTLKASSLIPITGIHLSHILQKLSL